jgi:OOP family OmpA-OmpF porin
MNKPSKFALALAFAAVTASGMASAQTGTRVDNWRNNFGDVWKNGTRELCWRDNFWTPATGIQGCDGVAAAPQAPAAKGAPVASKVVFNADTFFDFDKAVLKPEGRKLLDQVAAQVGTINLETIIAVGHTDSIGSVAYNQKLSERRAAAVKTYLVGKGIDPNRIYTEGKGKSQPVADNKTAAGRAKNRRVEIEIVGSRKD